MIFPVMRNCLYL